MRISVLFICFLSLSLVLGLKGQTDGKLKSKLNLKAKSSTPALPILVSKHAFRVNPLLQTSLSLRENSYFKQVYAATYAKSSTATVVSSMADRKLVEEGNTSDTYLFFNDRIQVSHLYPNPANDFVTIDYVFNTNQEAKIILFNVLGQEMKVIILDKDQRSQRVNLQDLNQGMYMYQLVIDGRSVATKKLIIRKQ